MKLNIAIDGPSSAGKSTIAKAIARKYHLTHIDTGAMYRCVALAVKRLSIDSENEIKIEEILPSINIQFDENECIYLNNENVTDFIRGEEISWIASTISKHFSVRSFLVAQQQTIASEKGYILDGRDIGTVVLPNAEVKIFLTADPSLRANRRFLEYQSKDIECSFEEVFEDIKKRDFQDSNRVNSPLEKASDAIEIDTSVLSIDEVLTMISLIIDSKLKGEENHD